MEEVYNIKLPVFEGPFDLLLHLIRENKLDIYDIPISLITRKYLDYIEMMKVLNLEIAGEFLVTASTLVHIKSRMLLPVEATLDTSEPEDPRLELVRRLLDYQTFKDAALGLKEKEEDWQTVYTRAPELEQGEEEPAEQYLFDLNIFDLLGAFRKLLDRTTVDMVSITKETMSVRDKIAQIINSLETKKTIRFEELFEDDYSKAHLIITFIALLEVLKLGLARAYQEKEFGSIWIIEPDAEVPPANSPAPAATPEPQQI